MYAITLLENAMPAVTYESAEPLTDTLVDAFLSLADVPSCEGFTLRALDPRGEDAGLVACWTRGDREPILNGAARLALAGV